MDSVAEEKAVEEMAQAIAGDRARLVDFLEKLPESDIQSVINQIEGAAAKDNRLWTASERVGALIGFAESSAGCGLLTIARIVAERYPDQWTAFRSAGPTHRGSTKVVTTGGRTLIERVVRHTEPVLYGREGELDAIHASLHAGGAVGVTQAVTGLGGVGKSAVVREYAKRHGDDYAAVFWVNASSPTSLIASYREIDRQFSPPTPAGEDDNALTHAVRRDLNDLSGYLLILDNADFGPGYVAADLLPSLPDKTRGSWLITSRTEGDLHGLGVKENAMRRLEELSSDAAVRLLWERRHGEGVPVPDEEKETLFALAKALEHFPLALAQATAYIAETRMSYVDYLDLYGQAGEAFPEPPSLEDIKDDDERKYRNVVRLTWKVNLDALTQSGKQASVKLFYLSAFLDADDIPVEVMEAAATGFLPALKGVFDDARNAKRRKITFNSLIDPLGRFGLAEKDSDRLTYSVHRLVQRVVRDTMTTGEQQMWLERAVNILSAAFPDVEFANWLQCSRLTAHVQVLRQYAQSVKFINGALLDIYYKAATYLKDQHRLDEALIFIQESLNSERELLPPDHPNIATSLISLGYLYREQNRLSEALPLFEEALSIYRASLPADHPFIATSLNNLAGLYRSQNRLSEAEPLYVEALAIRREVLPDKHPDIAGSLNSLAGLYESQNRLTEALPLFEESLSIRRASLPSGHPDIAGSLNNLAGLYQSLNRPNEALPLYQESLSIYRASLPVGHPDIAFSLNNLGYLYESLNRPNEALPLYEEALSIRRASLPVGHPDIAFSLNNLGYLYRSLNRPNEALPLYEEALQIVMVSLPQGHPTQTTIRENVMWFRIRKAMQDGNLSDISELVSLVLTDDSRPMEWRQPLIEAFRWLFQRQEEKSEA